LRGEIKIDRVFPTENLLKSLAVDHPTMRLEITRRFSDEERVPSANR
jgi:hypothetical protein